MRQKTKRRLLDTLIFLLTWFVLATYADAPWWVALVLSVFGLWNFYDGQTRGGLDA